MHLASLGLGGKVEMTPVMSAEDIQKALPSVPGIIAKYGGKVLKTSLSKEDEAALQEALHGTTATG